MKILPALLELLQDGTLQQTFVVMGFVFTFVGVSGLTWKKENLTWFPRVVFSVLGFLMLVGAGLGYFEHKNQFVSKHFGSEKQESNFGRNEGQPSPANNSQTTTQKGKKNNSNSVGNIDGNYNNVTQRNNSHDILTYIEGDKIYYYTLDTNGNKNSIREETIKPKEDELTDEEVQEKQATRKAKNLNGVTYKPKDGNHLYFIRFHSPDGNTIQYTAYHHASNLNGTFEIIGNNLVSSEGTLVMQGNDLVGTLGNMSFNYIKQR